MPDASFDFQYLCKLVREQAGIVLGPHQEYLTSLHLDKVTAQAGFDSLASFVEHLKRNAFGELHRQAIEALVINETSFFRDAYPFESLQFLVLPALMQTRSTERSINIWCAACSTGQEPYSIAMLIRETFPELLTWNLRIIASDFSQKVLERAQKGQYTNLEMDRGLTPDLRDRYFQKTDQVWQIRDEIRQMIEFRALNLIYPWDSLPKMDIIFLRNVLIYFDLDTRRSILNQVRHCLQTDGYLFLGGGETTFQLDSRFEVIQDKTSLYHRLRSL